MFELIKKCCFIGITFSSALTSVNPLKCVWMNNQPCKIRHDIVSINSDEPTFYPYSIKTNKSVVVLIISMIHMQKFVFLMLLKT